ncbi:MAG: DUF2752 domain-containing protein, partial [Phycisphaerae bacterium]|nr:DUF2752 domain-containing protein [Phycisphaerae bacterium]
MIARSFLLLDAMRFKIVHVSRRPPWPWWAGAVVATWLVLGGVVTYVSGCMGLKVVLCFFKRLTGIPCPTCGFSRGLLCILRGDIAGALWHNPLVFSILAVFLAVM